MLLPVIVSATSMGQEWLRFMVTVGCIGGAWSGSYLMGKALPRM